MSTTATSAPPPPLSESGHGVMIAPFREILADAFEPRDLSEGQIGHWLERDDGSLPRRQAPRKSTRRE